MFINILPQMKQTHGKHCCSNIGLPTVDLNCLKTHSHDVDSFRLLLALSFAVAVQQGFSTTFGSGDVASVMLSADVAGMLGLATLYEKKSMEEQARRNHSTCLAVEPFFWLCSL